MRMTPSAYASRPLTPAQDGERVAATLRYGAPLVARYSADALRHGYAALPVLILETYRALGLTDAELCFVVHLVSYARGPEPPRVATAALAQRMDCSRRRIQDLSARLVRRGLLTIIPAYGADGRQDANHYDFQPLVTAAVGLARVAEPAMPPTEEDARQPHEVWRGLSAPAPTLSPHARQDSPRACVQGEDAGGRRGWVRDPAPLTKVEKKESISISTPLPLMGRHDETGDPCAYSGSAGDGRRGIGPDNDAPTSSEPDPGEREITGSDVEAGDEHNTGAGDESAAEDTIAAVLGHLSIALGDDAPAASATRAVRLWRTSQLAVTTYLTLLSEAEDRTRARGSGIYRRTGDGQANRMPYLFAVLTDLVAHHGEERGPARGERQRRGSRAGTRGTITPATAAVRVATTSSPVPAMIATRTADYEKGADASGVAAVPEPATDVVVPSPDATTGVWPATLRELGMLITHENVDRWFASLRVVAETDDALTLEAATAFGAQWAGVRLRGRLDQALARVAPGLRVTVNAAEEPVVPLSA